MVPSRVQKTTPTMFRTSNWRTRVPSSVLSQCRTLIGIVRFAAVGANPDTFCVIDGIVARTAVGAHGKYSSAPARYLAFFRGSHLRRFATLIFRSHTFLIRPKPGGLQSITARGLNLPVTRRKTTDQEGNDG